MGMKQNAEKASTDSPASATIATARSAGTMSKRLWDFDWADALPVTIQGVTIDVGTWKDATAFMAEHYGSIFGDVSDRFLVEPMTEAKQRFCEELDVLVLRNAAGKTLGICVGQPTDWSTYYFRSFAILPELRERGFSTEYQHVLHAALSSNRNIARWEVETSNANVPMIRVLLSSGFVITAMINSERWGAIVRLTKFTNRDAEAVFRRQFVNVPAFGRDPAKQQP